MPQRFVLLLVPGLLAALLFAPLGAPQAVADEKEKADALVTRLFDIGALTAGRPDFLRTLSMSAELYAEDEQTLFGAEAEEPWYPVGQVDELIELIKSHVRADSWESTLGAGIRSSSEDRLIVRCFPDVMDTVATYLGALQQRVMRRVCVEVETFRLTRSGLQALLAEGSTTLADAGKLEALRGSAAAGPSVSLVAYEHNRAAVFSGTQRAYVGDYDVEVAWGANTSDPIVYVDNAGLSADVSATLSPDSTSAVVQVGASLSRLLDMKAVDTGEGRVIELPENAIAHVQSRIDLPVGRWALLEGQSADQDEHTWTFAIRVTALPTTDLAAAARGIALDAPAERPARTFELRTFDIGMLVQNVQSRLGEDLILMPSNFTPPEPPELPEPAPIFAVETIVDLLRETIVPASWELRGTFLDARNGQLYARNTPAVLDAIGSRLATLRREFIWSTVTSSEIVEVSDALGRRLQAAPDRVLTAAGAAEIEAAVKAGEARRLGLTRVATMRGGRNAVTSGRRRAYISDYEVEIAGESTIANPVIQRCLSGTVLDVRPNLTAGGQAAETVLRFARTEVKTPLRKVLTPHGELSVPEMEMFRLRAALQVPLGKTLIAGSAGKGGLRRLLLVTTRLRSSRR